MNTDELTINPEKVDDVVDKILELMYKKKKTKKELTQLWVLCLVAFGLKPKEVRKLVKFVGKRIPNKNIKTREQLEKDIEEVLDRTIIISKNEA